MAYLLYKHISSVTVSIYLLAVCQLNTGEFTHYVLQVQSGYRTHQSLTDAAKHSSQTHAVTLALGVHLWWSPGALSGASPSCTQYGNTALLAAAFGGSVEMARMLLDECGSTVNEVNNVSMMFTTLSPGAVEEVCQLVWYMY